jgi:hypothetical protein
VRRVGKNIRREKRTEHRKSIDIPLSQIELGIRKQSEHTMGETKGKKHHTTAQQEAEPDPGHTHKRYTYTHIHKRYTHTHTAKDINDEIHKERDIYIYRNNVRAKNILAGPGVVLANISVAAIAQQHERGSIALIAESKVHATTSGSPTTPTLAVLSPFTAFALLASVMA